MCKKGLYARAKYSYLIETLSPPLNALTYADSRQLSVHKLGFSESVTVQSDRQNRVCIAAEIAEEHNSYQKVIIFESVLKSSFIYSW